MSDIFAPLQPRAKEDASDGIHIPNKFSSRYLSSFRFKVNTFIDIGVAHGTPELYRLFAKQKIVLIDPLPGVEEELAKQYRGQFDYQFFQTAVGSAPGKVTFNVMTGRGKSGIPVRSEMTKDKIVEQREVEVTTLDALLATQSFAPPFGLKIDTEGFELEVLKGAERTLVQTEFVIAEVSVKKRFVNSYRFSDVVSFLGSQGFELIDILNFRPRTQRFYDCLFMKYDSPIFG
jgi:FkbM family methyltransferase